MVHSSNALAVSSAALRADQGASPFSSTKKSSAYQKRKTSFKKEISRLPRKASPATLRRQLLAQKQQMIAQYLEKTLPQSYLFHVFAAPRNFLSAQIASKNAYKFTAIGFIIQRPAPLSEVFVFVRLPDSQAPLPVLNEIRRLKIMGKIVLSVLGIEDLAFHLHSIGIALKTLPKTQENHDYRRSL
ncbi:hypothetical protein FAI41_04010 [Acetobacteraceae bacterium]|nr:hypothetical protein FAI41_04010 [Acetobacteraceae bacterium]